jgi:hypothetical protein
MKKSKTESRDRADVELVPEHVSVMVDAAESNKFFHASRRLGKTQAMKILAAKKITPQRTLEDL